MGDYVYVSLFVPASLFEKTQALLEGLGEVANESYDNDQNRCAFFGFTEVNYGTLDFLDKLQAAGIAYDSNWESGAGFGEGTKSLRFTSKGEAQVMVVYESDRNPPLCKLLKLLNGDNPFEQLRDYLLEFQKQVTPLSWENQEEYAKRYLAIKLINPSP